MGMWTDGQNDRDYADEAHGPYRGPEDQVCRCKRCNETFTKPSHYPEWTVRICDACRAELERAKAEQQQGAA